MFNFIFGGISGLFHKWDIVCIDNHVFRMHYRGSVIIFLGAMSLVSDTRRKIMTIMIVCLFVCLFV